MWRRCGIRSLRSGRCSIRGPTGRGRRWKRHGPRPARRILIGALRPLRPACAGPIQTRARVPPNRRPADHNVSHPGPRRRTIGCPRPWRGSRSCASPPAADGTQLSHASQRGGPALRNLISSRNGAAAAFAGVALKMVGQPAEATGSGLGREYTQEACRLTPNGAAQT
jgi:hypothetical protein